MSESLAMPPRAPNGPPPGPPPPEYDLRGYEARVKIRYLVEKELEGEWVAMARLSEEADRMEELCEAIGGKIRIVDLKTGLPGEVRVFE